MPPMASFTGKGVTENRLLNQILFVSSPKERNISQLRADCSSTAQGNCRSLPGRPKSNVLPTRLFKLTQKAAGESGPTTRSGKESYG